MKPQMISEHVGDIFDSTPSSILIHACNTKGSWGKGVAAAFKKYVMIPSASPSAFQYYKHHCTTPSSPSISLTDHQKSLVGTCLLIPPFPQIKTANGATIRATIHQKNKRFWIACLFTSSGYGKNVDTPTAILKATENAIAHLARQLQEEVALEQEIRELKQERERAIKEKDNDVDIRALGATINRKQEELGGERMGCVSVRINSGLFGVPWKDTKEVLKRGDVPMIVVRPPSQADDVVESDDEGRIETKDNKTVLFDAEKAEMLARVYGVEDGKSTGLKRKYMTNDRGKREEVGLEDGEEMEKGVTRGIWDKREDAESEEGEDHKRRAEKSIEEKEKGDTSGDGVDGKKGPMTKSGKEHDYAKAGKMGDMKKGVKRKNAAGSENDKVSTKGKRRGAKQTKLSFGKGKQV
ncbi:MAG: hypothetical protein Q9166_004754 [cf. Caloplaca sp. 2 TL-2023]